MKELGLEHVLRLLFAVYFLTFFMVGAHEFGHFAMAEHLNLKVKMVSVGSGPLLVETTFGDGMVMIIRSIPFEGMVRTDLTDVVYYSWPLSKKLSLSLSGIIVNAFIGVLAFIAWEITRKRYIDLLVIASSAFFWMTCGLVGSDGWRALREITGVTAYSYPLWLYIGIVGLCILLWSSALSFWLSATFIWFKNQVWGR